MGYFMSSAAREVLNRAIALEEKNAKTLFEWSLRFLPYQPEVSFLLEEMAEEEKYHRRILANYFFELFEDFPVNEEILDEDPLAANSIDLAKHFFVINKGMAAALLKQVLQVENDTRLFYEIAAQNNSQCDLQKIYATLAHFEADHVQKIQKYLDGMGRQEFSGDMLLPSQTSFSFGTDGDYV